MQKGNKILMCKYRQYIEINVKRLIEDRGRKR